jgi:hypothetical protein
LWGAFSGAFFIFGPPKSLEPFEFSLKLAEFVLKLKMEKLAFWIWGLIAAVYCTSTGSDKVLPCHNDIVTGYQLGIAVGERDGELCIQVPTQMCSSLVTFDPNLVYQVDGVFYAVVKSKFNTIACRMTNANIVVLERQSPIIDKRNELTVSTRFTFIASIAPITSTPTRTMIRSVTISQIPTRPPQETTIFSITQTITKNPPPQFSSVQSTARTTDALKTVAPITDTVGENKVSVRTSAPSTVTLSNSPKTTVSVAFKTSTSSSSQTSFTRTITASDNRAVVPTTSDPSNSSDRGNSWISTAVIMGVALLLLMVMLVVSICVYRSFNSKRLPLGPNTTDTSSYIMNEKPHIVVVGNAGNSDQDHYEEYHKPSIQPAKSLQPKNLENPDIDRQPERVSAYETYSLSSMSSCKLLLIKCKCRTT